MNSFNTGQQLDAEVTPLIGGIKWRDGVDVDQIIGAVVDDLKDRGVRVAGVIQRSGRADPVLCQGVNVEFIGSDELLSISQELGPDATGCSLDPNRLAHVAGLLSETLEKGTDLLIINRYGKSEANGRGLIDCANQAVMAGIPVLMAVGWKYQAKWNAYHGGLGLELEPEQAVIADWCRANIKSETA